MPILGIDYGSRRVGVAVSDATGTIALPLRVIDVRSVAQAVEAVAAVVAERAAEQVVVGLPLNMNGSEGEMATAARAFAEALEEVVTAHVALFDERLSTCQIERVLLDADMSRKKRKGVRDKLAAQVILQAWMDAQSPLDHFDYMDMCDDASL
jgi:putative Holliday junction resolvase